MDKYELYKQCYLIREYERAIEREFENGTMRGTTHGCIGQEIIPVMMMELIQPDDYITGTHRCHGQVLAYTNEPYKLACEMMGKSDGFNQGMGGSQHIKTGNYITNGVTGGMAAVGFGMAMSLKKNNKDGIVISFLGDGGFHEGYVQETLNMAATFQAPILYICENNKYAMSTRTAEHRNNEIINMAKALGIEGTTCDYKDPDKLYGDFVASYAYVKEKRKPYFLEVHTFRLCGHSKSDLREYMSEEEKKLDEQSDVLNQLKEMLDKDRISEIEREVTDRIGRDIKKAKECN